MRHIRLIEGPTICSSVLLSGCMSQEARIKRLKARWLLYPCPSLTEVHCLYQLLPSHAGMTVGLFGNLIRTSIPKATVTGAGQKGNNFTTKPHDRFDFSSLLPTFSSLCLN